MKMPLKYSFTSFLLLDASRNFETPVIAIYLFYNEIALFVSFIHVIILSGIFKA